MYIVQKSTNESRAHYALESAQGSITCKSRAQ